MANLLGEIASGLGGAASQIADEAYKGVRNERNARLAEAKMQLQSDLSNNQIQAGNERSDKQIAARSADANTATQARSSDAENQLTAKQEQQSSINETNLAGRKIDARSREEVARIRNQRGSSEEVPEMTDDQVRSLHANAINKGSRNIIDNLSQTFKSDSSEYEKFGGSRDDAQRAVSDQVMKLAASLGGDKTTALDDVLQAQKAALKKFDSEDGFVTSSSVFDRFKSNGKNAYGYDNPTRVNAVLSFMVDHLRVSRQDTSIGSDLFPDSEAAPTQRKQGRNGVNG